jgi:protein-disulfide isomerase
MVARADRFGRHWGFLGTRPFDSCVHRYHMKFKLDTVFTVAMVACAVVTVGVLIHHEFFPPATALATSANRKPVFVNDWKAEMSHGSRIGPVGAPVQIMEFADFECPFCAGFHSLLKDLRRQYPNQVSIVYVDFPLSMHRFAIPAIRAVECASSQGRFDKMYDLLFDQQQQLGLKSWREYASDADVPDLDAFDSCVKRADPIPRLEEGKKLGDRLNVKATPTVIINGWMLPEPPTSEELGSLVRTILAGKDPFGRAGSS